MYKAEEFTQGIECSNFRKYVVVIGQNHPRAQCYTVAFRLLSQFLKHGFSTGLRPHLVYVFIAGRHEEVVGPITSRVRCLIRGNPFSRRCLTTASRSAGVSLR